MPATRLTTIRITAGPDISPYGHAIIVRCDDRARGRASCVLPTTQPTNGMFIDRSKAQRSEP